MAAGMLHSGLTSVLHSATAPPSTRTMPTSVTRSRRGVVPVVSRSTKATAGANIGLDERTIVRYCTRVSNDRSYVLALQDYYARHRALPSYSSIGSLLGLRSKSSVAALVARLKLAGLLEATPDRRLAPTRRFFERTLADSPVRAGLPDAVDDAAGDALTIDDYLIEHPSRTVLVRVKGDSMVDAGVLDGDLVVVEKRGAARRGELAVA